MSADEFDEDVDTEFVDRDGETWAIATLKNIIMRMTEFRVFERLEFGPEGTFRYEYEPGEDDQEDGVLRLLDKAGVSVVELPEARETASYDRLGLLPEYDAISEVPEPDPDGPYADEPANPRGILRFTQAAADAEADIDEPGIYSYSVSEAAWVRLDMPEA